MQDKIKKPHFDFDFFEDLTGDIPVEPPRSVDDVGERIRVALVQSEVGFFDHSICGTSAFSEAPLYCLLRRKIPER